MIHPTLAGIGLIRLGDSDFVPANPTFAALGPVPSGQRRRAVRILVRQRGRRSGADARLPRILFTEARCSMKR